MADRMKINQHLPVVFLWALLAWMYWPVLSASYVWDDEQLLGHNAGLTSGDLNWAALSQPILAGSSYLRPVVLLSFAAEVRVAGLDPAVSHAVNLGLLMLNVSLVYWLAHGLLTKARFGAPGWRATLAAFLYAAHPALVESAAWVSARFDLMLTSFVLLALCTDLFVRAKSLRVALTTACFAAALGCKESAVVLPPCMLLVRLIHDRSPEKTAIQDSFRILGQERSTVAALGITFVTYLVFKTNSAGGLLTVGVPESVGSSISGHLLLVLHSLAYYVKLIFYPFVMISPLNPLEIHNAPSVLNTAVGIAGVAMLVCATVGIEKRWAPALLLSSGFVALLPVLNIVPLSITDNIGNNRFLALPLIFFCMAPVFVRTYEGRLLNKRLQIALTVVVAAGWSMLAVATTQVTVPLWKNPLTLWGWAYALEPGSRQAAWQYADAALNANRVDEAGKAIAQILQRQGTLSFREGNTYSRYLLRTGNLAEARRSLQQIIDTLPRYHAQIDEEAARREMGRTSWGGVLETAYTNLAILDAIEGHPEGVIRNIEVAMWYGPGNAHLNIVAAIFLEHYGRMDEARKMRSEAVAKLGEQRASNVTLTMRRSLGRYPQLGAWFEAVGSN